ncbi:hypothetical protein [Pseudoalteromonas piscicida]|uniref:hypothetical protein n=1 Tax=Pseudoalteromonas piscicida TaxID=43662 RepID=UPI003C7A1F02
MDSIEIVIGKSKFSIPENFLSNQGDLEGGVQSVVTLDCSYPSMGATKQESLYESLRLGRGLRVLLSDHGADPESSLSSVLRHKASEILFEKNLENMTIYETKDSSNRDYYFLSNEDEKLFFSCMKEAGAKYAMCSSAYKEIIPGVFVSYFFSKSLMSDVAEFDQKTKQILNRFKVEAE